MSDYIKRKKAIDAIVQYLGRINRDFKNWKGTARIILDHVPTEDVQPVVRCKDCRYNRECSIQFVANAGDKFFCGAGERRQDE